MNQSPFKLILAVLLALLLSACATSQNNYDPIEPTNRVIDTVNDGIDRVTLKPIARGYTAVVPKPMRTAVSNFYDNATYLNTVLNDFLQGKGQQGFEDLIRFLINTTLGVGGLVDVASSMGLERHEEDFGQTLAVWGVGKSAYIVYPLLGPNSVRNTPDFITSTATDPLFWASLALAPAVTIPVTALKYIDKRAQLLDASDMRDELALDPYIFTREAWRQNREYQIHDGNPPKPEPDSDDDGWEEDEWGNNEGEEGDDFAEATPQPKTRISMQGVSSESGAADKKTDGFDVTSADIAAASSSETISKAANGQMFVINLESFATEIGAVAEQGRLARENIQTEIKKVRVNGHTWYRLYSSRPVHKERAKMELDALKVQSGLTGAWLEPVQP